MTPCARGCTRNGQHKPGCGCTPTCPNHPGHCHGCAPYDADTGQLCRACTNRVRDALHTIPDLMQQLTGHPAPRNPDANGCDCPQCTDTANEYAATLDNHAETIHTKPIFGSQTNSPAIELADDTARLILGWVDLTCDMTEQVGPHRYTIIGIPDPHTSIGDLCHWLRENLAWAASNEPDAIHNELTRQRRTLEHALSLDRHVERIPEPCPSCGTGQLTREDGTEDVCCDNPTCNRIWRQAEWLARVGARA